MRAFFWAAWLGLCSTPLLAAPLQGFSFAQKDWELACDNTGTCRAAGYSVDGAELPISLLLTSDAYLGHLAQMLYEGLPATLLADDGQLASAGKQVTRAVGNMAGLATQIGALLGNTANSIRLERELSAFLNGRQVVLYATGWQAGYASVQGFVRPHDHVVIDVLAHSCLQEGADRKSVV